MPQKQDEAEPAEPLPSGGVGGAVPHPSAPQEKTEPTSADKPAESGEPAALPTAPVVGDSEQTNGAAKLAVAEPVAAAAAAAAAAETSTEPVPATTETPGANGEAKPAEDVDMEGSAPVADATTATDEDSTAANSKKRNAETALGPDAHAEGDAAGGKKAKTPVSAAETATATAGFAPGAKPEEAKTEAKTEEAKSPAETNGGGAGAGTGAGAGAKPADPAAAPPAPPAPPAKKGGRPKKQPGKVAAAAAALMGKTARKTRSQGPVEL